jgi:Tfp pilus assembly protein PilO
MGRFVKVDEEASPFERLERAKQQLALVERTVRRLKRDDPDSPELPDLAEHLEHLRAAVEEFEEAIGSEGRI